MTEPLTLPEIRAALQLPPEQAIAFFRSKGYLETYSWEDAWQEDHARAFTVAKAMERDVLEAIRAAVDQAIADGTTLQQFRTELQPQLEAMGWWGKAEGFDGQQVQLGSPSRLRVIFDTNLRTSYAVGRWQRAVAGKDRRPFMRYVAVLDRRTRSQHRAWHGTILPIDHPWWGTHFPPCGWGCRCTNTTLDQRTIDARGWKVTEEPIVFPARTYRNKRTGVVSEVPGGIDPGWAYNVGQSALSGVTPPILPTGGAATAATQDAVDQASQDAAVNAFFAPFGMRPQDERVFVDAGGWPMAIGPGLFVDAAGQFVPPPADRYEALAAAGRVIVQPSEIRWRWVPDDEGKPQLVRRYLGRAGELGVAADIGRAGWRFTTPAERADEGDGQEVVAWRAATAH